MFRNVNLRTKAPTSSKGFTIVELLIVIVVIGILAAITIVAYNGIQNRAKDAALKSDAASAARLIQQNKITNAQATGVESYPATKTDMAVLLKLSTGTSLETYIGNSSTPTRYCMTLKKGDTFLSSTETTSQLSDNECVTNLVPNPRVANDLTGWTSTSSTGGNPTPSRATLVSGLAGTTTAMRTNLTGTPASWWRGQYCPVSVTAGQSYSLSSYVRPSVAVSTGMIIIWRNSSGATISESGGAFVASAASTWGLRTSTGVAPVGAVSACLQGGASGAGAAVSGSWLDLSEMVFEQSATAHAYGDGDSTNWFWTGSEHASTSVGPSPAQ